MSITIDLGHAIGILSGFLVCIAGLAKIILKEIGNRDDRINERVSEQATRMDDIEKSLHDIASRSAGAPTHNDLANVYHAQNRTEEKLNQLIGETRSQSDLLRLIMGQITKKGME